jgi:predicted PurR-regulated permease PerM
MTAINIVRDERTVAAENASYRWGFLVLSFGLLLATAYRSFVAGDAAWDLLGLVILGGVVTTAYQAAQHVISRRRMTVSIAAMLAAALIAAILVVSR